MIFENDNQGLFYMTNVTDIACYEKQGYWENGYFKNDKNMLHNWFSIVRDRLYNNQETEDTDTIYILDTNFNKIEKITFMQFKEMIKC